jgi:hypothetical protein
MNETPVRPHRVNSTSHNFIICSPDRRETSRFATRYLGLTRKQTGIVKLERYKPPRLRITENLRVNAEQRLVHIVLTKGKSETYHINITQPDLVEVGRRPEENIITID